MRRRKVHARTVAEVRDTASIGKGGKLPLALTELLVKVLREPHLW